MLGFGYAMGLVAAIVQKYAYLQITPAYSVELSLFCLTIAASGTGKGTMAKLLLQPMEQIKQREQLRVNRENAERIRHNAAVNDVIAAKKRAARHYSGAALEANLEELAELHAMLRPILPEYVFDVQDVTSAALMKELATQDGHSLFIQDPEGRVLRSIREDKYLAVLLNQAFVGEPVKNSRAGKGSCSITNPHVSMAAAIQPDKLKKLGKESALWGEGFIPRTLPYFARSPADTGVPFGELTDPDAMKLWENKIKSLCDRQIEKDSLGRIQRHQLMLDDEASRLFSQFTVQIQQLAQLPDNEGIAVNLNRLPEITARVAAIYHFIENLDPLSTSVSGMMMHYAVATTQFFLGQICKLYAIFFPNPVLDVVWKLCDELKACFGTKDYVTQKMLYDSCGSAKRHAQSAIKVLCNWNVLTPVQKIDRKGSSWLCEKIIGEGFLVNFQVLASLTY